MSKTCLVVDDSSTIRKVVRRMMEKLNFEVTEAEHGADALEKCIASMPECIMLDWNMPVMSGIEFLRALRKTPGGTAPTVILCTTENDFSRIQEAMTEGANEYIMKPFTEDIIREKLEMVGVLA
jgi:two-component system chemotaxis response regulator CheY